MRAEIRRYADRLRPFPESVSVTPAYFLLRVAEITDITSRA